jgi:hypothetical protein
VADYKKLTINLAADLHEDLQRMAQERGINVSELIRRAIALDKFVWEHREEELLLKNGDTTRQIVLI